MSKLDVTEYRINNKCFGKKVRFALVSDLHSRSGMQIDNVINQLKTAQPDYILCPGDIFERLDGSEENHKKAGFELLSAAAEIAPTFYSIGNHENGGVCSWNAFKWMRIDCIPKYYDSEELDKIWETGVVLLDDGFVVEDDIAFGGLASGLINQERRPNLDWLEEFCACDCPKVLLCHHPEYYKKYLADKNIDLIVSGHAHGGQWRVFGRGVFAPGQGIFPKYTSGLYRGKLLVSRGLANNTHIPRIFNDTELIMLYIK